MKMEGLAAWGCRSTPAGEVFPEAQHTGLPPRGAWKSRDTHTQATQPLTPAWGPSELGWPTWVRSQEPSRILTERPLAVTLGC